MDWSLSKIIRIETGAVGISTNDLVALLRLYKVKDSQRVKELITRAKAARQQAWWSKYRAALPPTYFQYIEYETSASIIRSYETILIPGLLQTEEYATAVVQQSKVDLPSRQVKSLIEVRMRRQELLLKQPKPPLLFFVLDEAVIRRLTGDQGLRKTQLEKLIELAGRREVTIEILPFAVGLHRGMTDNFNILEFPGSADDVLYFESGRGAIFSRDVTEEVTAYRELFEDLRRASLGPKGTLDYFIETANAIR